MTPLSLVLIMAGWVLVWTSIKGDGYGGHNPLNVIRSALSGERTGAAIDGVAIGTVSAGGPGVYEDFGPWNDPDGNHQTHGHFAGDPLLVVNAGRALQELGFRVTGHLLFPPVGVHTDGSYHYSQRAIDYNWPGPDERAQLSRARGVILDLANSSSGVSAVVA